LVISRSHTPLSLVSTFVRFSDYHCHVSRAGQGMSCSET
jgi:hypothetical protein